MDLQLFADRIARLVNTTDSDRKIITALPFTTSIINRRRTLLTRGDRPDFLYLILSGWAARYDERADRSRRTTAFMVPGDFCSIHAICNQPMDHSIVALTNCVVGRVELRDLIPAMASNATIEKGIWVSKLADEALLRLWMLKSRDAAEMLAHLICELHMRTHHDRNATSAQMLFPITQDQLAEALNLTPIHVNRTFKKLREEGLVIFATGKLELPDVPALRRRAAFDPTYFYPLQPL